MSESCLALSAEDNSNSSSDFTSSSAGSKSPQLKKAITNIMPVTVLQTLTKPTKTIGKTSYPSATLAKTKNTLGVMYLKVHHPQRVHLSVQ
jgi:hypothetical protein